MMHRIYAIEINLRFKTNGRSPQENQTSLSCLNGRMSKTDFMPHLTSIPGNVK